MSKTVLITGGAGFIAHHVIDRILNSTDWNIVSLDRLDYSGNLNRLHHMMMTHDADVRKRVKIIYHDLKAEINPQTRSMIGKVDIIMHLAAGSHVDRSIEFPMEFVMDNVVATCNILNYSRTIDNLERFVYFSTDEVFGDLPLEGNEKFTPETPYNPSSPYSSSKASSDLLVRAWVRSFGLKATISNCSNNFGPYQHQEKLIPRMISLIAAGKKPELYGNGANVRDWIHVDDHNDGVWAILDRGEIGKTYLLGADNQRSNLQVVKALLKIMGKPEDFIEFIADRPGHDLRYAIDASATEAELGWKPKHGNFEEKLAETVEWYLANKETK